MGVQETGGYFCDRARTTSDGEEKGAGRMFSALPGFLVFLDLSGARPSPAHCGLQLCLLSQMHSLASAVHKRLRHLLGCIEVTPISIICLFIVVSFASSNKRFSGGTMGAGGVSRREKETEQANEGPIGCWRTSETQGFLGLLRLRPISCSLRPEGLLLIVGF